jgi:predicted nucleic-acid-binding protein
MKKPAALPDTNYILRYLLRDNESQFAETSGYFELLRSGNASALLLESVVVECLYILTKHYHVPRPEAAASLSGILLYKGITNYDRDALVKALSLFGEGTLDPVDCVLAAKSTADGLTLLTFDKALAKCASKADKS